MFERPQPTPLRMAVGAAGLASVALLWWFAAGYWVLDALSREGGILVDNPRPLR